MILTTFGKLPVGATFRIVFQVPDSVPFDPTTILTKCRPFFAEGGIECNATIAINEPPFLAGVSVEDAVKVTLVCDGAKHHRR